jgi:hypothetical protein
MYANIYEPFSQNIDHYLYFAVEKNLNLTINDKEVDVDTFEKILDATRPVIVLGTLYNWR